MKNLTPYGLEEIKEETIYLPEKPKDNKEIIKEFNQRPEVKERGIKAVNSTTDIIKTIAIVILVMIIGAGMIWFNMIFEKKDFSITNSNPITNNIDSPDIPITNQYNQTTKTIVNMNTTVIPRISINNTLIPEIFINNTVIVNIPKCDNESS